MSDAAAQPPAPVNVPDALGHDGMASRVFLLSTAAFVLPFGIASVAFFTGRLEAPAWVEMSQWLVTSVCATYGVTNMGQRLATAFALRGQ